MRGSALLAPAALAAVLLAPAPAGARAGNELEPLRVLWLAPADGPEAVRAGEALRGLEAAFAEPAIDDHPAVLTSLALPDERKPLEAALARAAKDDTSVVVAWARDGGLPELERACGRAKLPLLVLSPEPTRMDLDPRRAVFWAGGVRPVEEALQAMDFLLLPLGSHRPAVLHDGTPRALDAAARCARLHHVSQTPSAPRLVDPGFDAAAAAGLAADGADAVVYFGGPQGAERVLAATAAAELELPVLLGQGLVSAAVPTFAEGRAPHAWALEVAAFEDRGGLAPADQDALGDALAKAGSGKLLPGTIRGYRAGRRLQTAVRNCGDPRPKHLVPAIRALAHERARGRPAFEPWGHSALGRFEAWRSPAVREDPACHRVRDTYLPMWGIPQIGFFPSERFRYEPGTFYVQVTFGEGEKRTIERDLKALGLHTGTVREPGAGAATGPLADAEARVLDDLLGRTMSRLHRMFLRDPDGTGIPGISFNISFGTADPPEEVKSSRRWFVVVAGDDPAAGGRASGDTALVFSTFLQRTMYAEHRLAPPLGPADLLAMAGRYRWNTSLEENLRGDTVRALLDGYTQAMGLTGAHELGHLAGCGHDTETPRSIMNVVDAVGLDFEWAEWIPSHVAAIETRVGRVPLEKR